MDKVLTQLVERLQKAYGDRLVSVVLYGSAAAGDHHPGFSDYNVLCVLSEITSRQLGAGEDVFRWWREQGQKASGMLSDANLLRRLLLDSVSTFCVLFRHALILHGIDAPSKKREVIQRAAEQFGFDPQPCNQLLDVREERIKPRQIEPVALLDSFLQCISKVIDAVDRLEK
jgi:hypothetical protein